MGDVTSGEPHFLNRLSGEVRSLMEAALNGTIEPIDVKWTEKRWDAADVTATWDLDDSHRNIHGWLGGDWPSFSLQFEGAAWQDDEHRLRRRVIFLSGPTSALKISEGGKQQPKIDVSGSRESLTANLRELIQRLQTVQLRDAPWQYSLQPRPRSHTTGQT